MRCLHLTLTTARGGRRDAILTLIRNLRALGVTSGLVGLRDAPEQLEGLSDEIEFHTGLLAGPRPGRKAIGNLWRLCRDERVELLHVHDAGSQTVASALRCVLPKLRIVMTFHRTLGVDSEGWRNKIRNRITLPAVSRVITASEERRRYFIKHTGIAERRVAVIPHGVDLELFHPDTSRREWARQALGVPPDTVLVAAVGHYGHEKGLDQVVAGLGLALPHLGAAAVHLVVLGTGTPDQERSLRELSASLLGGRVTFLGFRTDVSAWLQGTDLLVHAPRLEAFGLVTIQAMACGIPVVATAVGGLPEIVLDGETGRLVAPGDLGALGSAIAALAGDADARTRAGHAALKRARAWYDARESARRHVSLYQAALG